MWKETAASRAGACGGEDGGEAESLVCDAGAAGFPFGLVALAASKVPHETLRSFLKSDKHQLAPANEEKLARALGFDGAFFRWLVWR